VLAGHFQDGVDVIFVFDVDNHASRLLGRGRPSSNGCAVVLVTREDNVTLDN
jgi:hypothetical protein